MPGSGKPFRFLDYYNIDDADLFFGREKETRILIADVLVNRLVVLFAPTGTGKTSLIHAGVRPQLEKQGYTTFFVRVHEDPVESARAELRSHPELVRLKGARFCDQLENAAKQLKRPIVVFFDQFEEFFIYVYNRDRKKAREFIADVGSLYHNDESRVHVVLSMREEFFVEMDAFRDDIPTVFHNECNLRLRGFEREQARDAIVYPFRAFDVWIEPGLVDRIIADLSHTSDLGSQGSEIEPAQLQIVCDTLWSKRKRNVIKLADYVQLGGSGVGNIAERLLVERFLECFEEITAPEQLDLLQRMLPLLRTQHGTKYVRQVQDLADALETKESPLRELLSKLEKAHFIRVAKRSNLELIELAHDYLVEHLDDLCASVRIILPRRTLRAAVSRFTLSGELARTDELQAISPVIREIALDRKDAEFVFTSSLAFGYATTPFFNAAVEHGVDVWQILRQQIFAFGPKEATRAFECISDLALQGVDLKPGTELPTEAFQLATEALENDERTLIAQAFFAKVVNSRVGPISHKARNILLEFLKQSIETRPIASEALAALGSVESLESLSLIESALPEGPAQDALVRLTTAENHEVALEARGLAIRFVRDALAHDQLPRSAIRALGEIESPESLNLIREALLRKELAPIAMAILKNRLSKSANAEVASGARQAIADMLTSKPIDVPTTLESFENRDIASHQRFATSELAPWDEIVDSVRHERCVLLLGPGVHSAPPVGSVYQYPEAQRPPMGRTVAEILAQESGFLSAFPDEDGRDLARVAEWYDLKFGRARLVDTLRRIFARTRPSPMLQALAALPFTSIITACFDRLFEEALHGAKKLPEVLVYNPEPLKTQDVMVDPSSARPLVYKIYGDIKVPESIVISVPDFIQHALRMSDWGEYRAVPDTILYNIIRFPTLVLGLSFRDYHLRFLWKTLGWKRDRLPRVLAVDPWPDPLFTEAPQLHRDLLFIKQDIWIFVRELYRSINAIEPPF
jgi:hypothetical protein